MQIPHNHPYYKKMFEKTCKKYPYMPDVIGKTNPYTKEIVTSREDYNKYLIMYTDEVILRDLEKLKNEKDINADIIRVN